MCAIENRTYGGRAIENHTYGGCAIENRTYGGRAIENRTYGGGEMSVRLPVIKVVGVSASGKSTLTARLRKAGYDARPVSQEHSGVADLWRKFDFPQVLIYLDATLEAQQARRPDVSWDAVHRTEEEARLSHARDHADLQIDTTQMTAESVLAVVLAYLERRRVRHAATSLSALGETGAPRKRSVGERTPEPITLTHGQQGGKKRRRNPLKLR